MTDLQILVKQTSNSSVLKMQQRLHDEVVQLGKQALKWKADYEALQLAFETERDAANLYAKQVAHWMHKHDALLAQQLEVAESRDAYAKAADDMAAAHKVERDALELRIGAMIVERSDAFFKVIQERDALQSELDLARRKLAVLSNADALENLYQVGLKQEFDITALTKERDALKEAAKLALDALEAAISNDRRPYLVKSEEAIAALKAVLK